MITKPLFIRIITGILLCNIIFYSRYNVNAADTIYSHKTTNQAAISHTFKQNEDTKEPIPPFLLPYTAVIIDAGHGGIDSGASAGDVFEKDINLAVAKKLYLLLQSKGVPTILNRTGDYALSSENYWHKTSSRHLKDLSQRMGLTREIEHVIFISLHVNASPNSSKAHGPLVIHQQSGESALLATYIQNSMNEFYGTRKLPVPSKAFYLLNYIKAPTVIVELGFISNANDRQLLTNKEQQTRLAEAIANGVSHYFWIN